MTSASLNGSLLTNPGPSKTLTFTLGTPDNGAVLGSPSTNTLTIVQPLRPSQLAIAAPVVNTTQQAVVTVTVSAVGYVPTGDVTLTVNGVPAVPVALANGQATFNLGNVPEGIFDLVASYAVQNGYGASTGTGTLTVNRAPSLLYLTQSPKVYNGQPISIVANFGIGLGPGGSVPVQCYTDSSLGTPIPVPTDTGTYFAAAGFDGDATYLPTSLAESFTIGQVATRIDLFIAATNPNTGSPVAATGVVTFVDDTFAVFGVFIDVGTASFPPTFTYYLASDTGFANPLAGPPGNSGDYVVVATVAATANYRASSASAAFRITGTESLVVTTTVDENNGTSSASFGSGTSLREAFIYAQSLGGPQTITFAPGLAGQTVMITSDGGNNSALVISTAVTIQGLATSPGVTLAVGAGARRRHFYVTGSGALTLRNLTLIGGFSPAVGGSSGGGSIYSEGHLDVTGCNFAGNQSEYYGGALFIDGSSAQARITNSTFTGNTAARQGGAIYSDCELFTLTHVTIADNTATFAGGGIRQAADVMRLVNCLVARNTANGSPSDVHGMLDAANCLNNLISAEVGSGLANGVNGNQVGVPMASLGLGALADNGGPTRTLALQTNSPALNAGATVAGVTTDQRARGDRNSARRTSARMN